MAAVETVPYFSRAMRVAFPQRVPRNRTSPRPDHLTPNRQASPTSIKPPWSALSALPTTAPAPSHQARARRLNHHPANPARGQLWHSRLATVHDHPAPHTRARASPAPSASLPPKPQLSPQAVYARHPADEEGDKGSTRVGVSSRHERRERAKALQPSRHGLPWESGPFLVFALNVDGRAIAQFFALRLVQRLRVVGARCCACAPRCP